MGPTPTRRRVLVAGLPLAIPGCAGAPEGEGNDDDAADAIPDSDANVTDNPEPDGPAFEIVALESPKSSIVGEVIDVAYAIANVGDRAGTAVIAAHISPIDGDEQSMTVEELLEHRDGDRSVTVTDEVPLDAGGSHRDGYSLDTSGLEPGPTIVAIATQDDEERARIELDRPVVHVHNPYEGVDWDAVGRQKCEFHNHPAKWEAPHRVVDLYHGSGDDAAGRRLRDGDGYTVYSIADMGIYSPTRWPWTELSDIDGEDRDPEALGVVSFPGAEIRHGIEHVSLLFTTATDHHHDADDRLGAITQGIESDTDEPKTLAVIAHPERYYGNPAEDWERYLDDFRTVSLEDGLVGFEILNKDSSSRGFGPDEPMPDLDLWDLLLTEFMPDRPIWGYSVDDASEFVIGRDIDVRWTEVLLHPGEFDPADQASSRRATNEAMHRGRFFGVERAQWNHESELPPEPARIESITVQGDRITMDVTGQQTIRWVSCGETVDTGREVALTREMTPYVRAEVWTESPATVTITQPFGLVVPADG